MGREELAKDEHHPECPDEERNEQHKRPLTLDDGDHGDDAGRECGRDSSRAREPEGERYAPTQSVVPNPAIAPRTGSNTTTPAARPTPHQQRRACGSARERREPDDCVKPDMTDTEHLLCHPERRS